MSSSHERSEIIEKLLKELAEDEFNPNDTAAFMKRERDRTGETEWRSMTIESYGALGRRLELVEQLARTNHEDILFKVSVESLKSWQKNAELDIQKRFDRQWVAIFAAAAIYGAIIGFIAEKVLH